MKTILSTTIAALMCFSLAVSAQTKKKSNDLDGKTYAISLTETSGKTTGWQWTTDQLSFNGGMLHSKMMHDHEQFEDAECTLDITSAPSGKTMTFTAEKKNPGGSKVRWKGTVTGDAIQGTAVWTNKQGTQAFSFKGSASK